MTVKVKVWDWPLRAFHWLLVLAVVAATATGELGGSWIDWHGRAGLAILGLLAFRIVWGFVGSTHSRFAQFFPTPARLLAYARGVWQGAGHNPLGALSVLALLAVLAAQVGTGLFANDDIAFEGPLTALIDKSLSDKLTAWHSRIFYALATLVGLHVASIAFYVRVKRKNLILPMITGHRHVPQGWRLASATVGYGRLAAAISLAGGLVWSVVNGLPERFATALDANAAVADAPAAAEPDPVEEPW